MIDGAPKIVDFAVNAEKHFIQMPAPLRPGSQMPCPLATDLGGEERTKTVPPISHRLMAHIDPAREADPQHCAAKAETYNITARRIISGEVLK